MLQVGATGIEEEEEEEDTPKIKPYLLPYQLLLHHKLGQAYLQQREKHKKQIINLITFVMKSTEN
jgi:hypothetical protein